MKSGAVPPVCETVVRDLAWRMHELPQCVDRKRRVAAVDHGVAVRADRAKVVDWIDPVAGAYG